MHGSIRGSAEREALRLDRRLIQPVLGTVQRLAVAQRQPEIVLSAASASRTEFQGFAQHSVATNETAQIAGAIVLVLPRRSGKSAGAHQLVVGRQVRSHVRSVLRPRHEFPAPLREKTVVPAGDQLSAVLEPDPVRVLDDTPVCEDLRFDITPVVTLACGAIDCIARANLRDRPRGAVRHEHACVPPVAIDTCMLASAIRVDGLLEGNVGRVVGADDPLGPIRLQRRGDAVRLLLDVPAVIHPLEFLALKPSRRVRKGAPALEYLPSYCLAAHARDCTPIQLVPQRGPTLKSGRFGTLQDRPGQAGSWAAGRRDWGGHSEGG